CERVPDCGYCVIRVPVDEVDFSGPSTLVVGRACDSIVREEPWRVPVRSGVGVGDYSEVAANGLGNYGVSIVTSFWNVTILEIILCSTGCCCWQTCHYYMQ